MSSAVLECLTIAASSPTPVQFSASLDVFGAERGDFRSKLSALDARNTSEQGGEATGL